MLTITGMGQKAGLATAYTLKKHPPKKSDTIINIGLAGCGDTSVAKGSVFSLAGAAYEGQTLRLGTGRLCHTFTKPVYEDFGGLICDMEAFFVLQSALRYAHARQINIYKVISDHLEDAAIPSKEQINQYMQKAAEYENSAHHGC